MAFSSITLFGFTADLMVQICMRRETFFNTVLYEDKKVNQIAFKYGEITRFKDLNKSMTERLTLHFSHVINSQTQARHSDIFTARF